MNVRGVNTKPMILLLTGVILCVFALSLATRGIADAEVRFQIEMISINEYPSDAWPPGEASAYVEGKTSESGVEYDIVNLQVIPNYGSHWRFVGFEYDEQPYREYITAFTTMGSYTKILYRNFTPEAAKKMRAVFYHSGGDQEGVTDYLDRREIQRFQKTMERMPDNRMELEVVARGGYPDTALPPGTAWADVRHLFLVEENDTVTLNAIPNQDWVFSGWEHDQFFWPAPQGGSANDVKQHIITQSFEPTKSRAAFTYVGPGSADQQNLSEVLHDKNEQFKYRKVSTTQVEIVGYLGTETQITIPETLDGYRVVGIGSASFQGNTTIIGLSIPPNVVWIASRAFDQCHNLNDLKLSEGLVAIGDYAFSKTGLQKIDVPKSANSIGEMALPGNQQAGLEEGTEDINVTGDVSGSTGEKQQADDSQTVRQQDGLPLPPGMYHVQPVVEAIQFDIETISLNEYPPEAWPPGDASALVNGLITDSAVEYHQVILTASANSLWSFLGFEFGERPDDIVFSNTLMMPINRYTAAFREFTSETVRKIKAVYRYRWISTEIRSEDPEGFKEFAEEGFRQISGPAPNERVPLEVKVLGDYPDTAQPPGTAWADVGRSILGGDDNVILNASPNKDWVFTGWEYSQAFWTMQNGSKNDLTQHMFTRSFVPSAAKAIFVYIGNTTPDVISPTSRPPTVTHTAEQKAFDIGVYERDPVSADGDYGDIVSYPFSFSNEMSVPAGANIMLGAIPKDGYRFVEWRVYKGNGEAYSVTSEVLWLLVNDWYSVDAIFVTETN